MDSKIEKFLKIWHKHFSDEENHYTEFESSDIEYFVGCMLYNHFAFSKALDTMKTIDLSYDFLSSCGDDEYDEVKAIVESIDFDDELKKLEFLQNYISEAKSKYSKSELYLIDRLEYHTNSMAERYATNTEAKRVDFTKSTPKANPLLRG